MGDCSCIYIDCGDEPVWYREVRSRVNTIKRRCRECGRFLRPLEAHEKVRSRWDERKVQTYRTCDDCVSIRDEFFCEGYHYTRIWEDVWDHICEMDGHIDSSCMVGLTKVARDMLCDQIEAYWENNPEEELDD